MKASDIHLFDWQRIWIGEVPEMYFVELIIRAFVIYLILLIAMRSMGKRMSTQLSRNELAALVSLAAAVGVPMMAPDRGILPAVMIALVIVGLQRVIAKGAFHNQRFESFSQGNVAELLADGVINVRSMAKIGLSRERLVAELRSNGIIHLGEVKRVYLEANGGFSIIKNQDAIQGLSVLPASDQDFVDELEIHASELVCNWCGLSRPQPSPVKCTHCGHDTWKPAVTEKT
ncbi:DUF421 domain-containing protein [Mucilaginibacter defluvii]|uniref:YetF C-terminal domain-containing protein n=1 Tax=Mucilaginibacter defluvii TaxID=1196019 RepID=A0ABP9FKP6_9SPHI